MVSIKGKTVLVTGGTGSIGSVIVKNALKKGAMKVIMFSRDEIKQFIMRQRITDERLISYVGDIRDIESIRKVFEEYSINIVFHAAAMKHLVVCEDEPLECAKTNIIGTENLIRLCKQYKVSHVVGISTDKAASPTNVMGASKFIAERIVLNAAKNSNGVFTCVRFGNVANSRGSVIPNMVRRALDGNDIWISEPEVTRFIMRIEDAVELVMSTLDHAHGGELFILKMKAFRLGDLSRVMETDILPILTKKKLKIRRTKLVQGEKLHEDLLNEEDCKNLYENESMYLIPPSCMDTVNIKKKYPNFKKASTVQYSSNTVELMTWKEMQTIIQQHLADEYGIRGVIRE